MPQKQKLSLEEKVKIIQDYLEGTISKSEATTNQTENTHFYCIRTVCTVQR